MLAVQVILGLHIAEPSLKGLANGTPVQLPTLSSEGR